MKPIHSLTTTLIVLIFLVFSFPISIFSIISPASSPSVSVQAQAQPLRYPVRNFEVRGTKIFDPEGREFIPKGVNIQGYNWVWPRSVVQDADLIVNCWKFNLVRVNNLLLDHPQSTLFSDNNDLDKIIQEFTKRKIVVVLEAHDRTGSYYEGKDFNILKNWMREKAFMYRHNPYVWFNVMNEPGGFDQNFSKWVNLHKEIIRIIRNQARANNIIMVDGAFWGQDLGEWNSNPVSENKSAILSHGKDLMIDPLGNSFSNILFSIHTYDQWNYGNLKMLDFVQRARSQNLALIFGEYGRKNNQIDTSAATEAMYSISRKYGIGRIVWAWFGGDENDLTTSGNGGGWHIDNCSRPKNLSSLGALVWRDTHSRQSIYQSPWLPFTKPKPKNGKN